MTPVQLRDQLDQRFSFSHVFPSWFYLNYLFFAYLYTFLQKHLMYFYTHRIPSLFPVLYIRMSVQFRASLLVYPSIVINPNPYPIGSGSLGRIRIRDIPIKVPFPGILSQIHVF